MIKTTKKFKKINSELDFNITYDPNKAFEVLKNVEKKNAKMTSTFEKINIINNIWNWS